MIKSVKLRLAIVLASIVLAMIYLFPTMGGTLPDWWGKIFPTEKIHLGLDLQGGIHLLMEVDVEKALQASTDRMTDSIKHLLEEEKIKVAEVSRVETATIKFQLKDANELEHLQTFLHDQLPAWQHLSTQGATVLYQVSDKERQRIEKLSLDQAVETMRNRIDQFGVAEPEIRVQANNRILVQLPGVKDTARAIALIGKTALLEFKLVNEQYDPAKISAAELAKNKNLEVLYEQTRDPETNAIVGKRAYAIEKKSLMTGEYIANANVRFNSQFGEPYVSLEFNAQGAKLFDQITAANVKRRLAIILDNNVYSAPVIQERISGGQAQVSGRFTAKEAHDLAIVLRAGALPAPIRILEQRTVGPSLGRDSIQKGFISMVVGFFLVVGFMIFYYRLSGLVANLALVLNILFIMSMLALAQATLTLPGIAGIVLTIGMAVDANVLIFERIREELRLGKTPRAGLDSGYGKAFLTIMDANITTLIAGIVLYQFGTGPIKGFAVTLSVGIISSLYTAIFVTRLVFDMVSERRPLKKLSI
ncbi:MAG: protein translocase subunit SecD [Deltaproteobacteria bacterium]|nr:protein translocase subunit SecD [Deltaproteobacteria bacterium]